MIKERTKYNTSAILITTIIMEVLFFALVIIGYITLQQTIQGMRYEHPSFVWLFMALPVLSILYILSISYKNRKLKKFAEYSLIPYLVPDISSTRSLFKYILFRLGVGMIIIGMIDPKIGTKLQEVKTQGQDIFIALDISTSMRAEDIKPNRLERAKMALYQFIKELKGDRIGVIIFAGDAYVQLPLTTDYEAAKLFLDQVDTDLMSSQGTAIGDAISLAQESFDPESEAHKTIIVITDGENHEGEAISTTRKAAELGITIHAIGMGTPQGTFIPIHDRYGNLIDRKKDKNGITIITALNENMLKELVNEGNGGVFIRASNNNIGLSQLMNEIEGVEKADIDTFMYSDYEHRFQWFFGIGLFLLVMESLISPTRKNWSEVLGVMD